TCCRRALQIQPDDAEVHNNLGAILQELGHLNEAEAHCRRALQIKPDDAKAHNNLGAILHELGRLDEAEACFRQALQINPNYAKAHNNLGITLQDLGRLDEAEPCFKQALQIEPDYASARSNLLFSLNYAPNSIPSYCFAEARQYGQRITRKVASRFSVWPCAKNPVRLRVGLVSGDFNNHPVGYFLESLLQQLDSTAFELIAYPTNHKTDELTARIKPRFSAWEPLSGLNDEAAAQRIHGDGIHILIDLSGHTRHNRLPLFAWKPAPVQVSWLGYFATTGVAEIDYLIADPWTLPETEEPYFTEKIWRLPETRLCFSHPDIDLAVSPLPALTKGHITFGCFNNLTKMNKEVVALWSKVLSTVPGSRLFLKAKQLGETAVQQHTIERFAEYGIDAERLILEGAESREKYLTAYQQLDIALDPFPFPGGTTSVEGLWMGVPVLTLAGERFLSRQGVGIVMNAGLPDWVAADADDYVARAAAHAGDLQSLSKLRNELRQQTLASPLMDAKRFAIHFATALQGMYQAWSNGEQP
ncbi:MAG: tetratricopeptide repeat protein, partial [Sulfurimicrobium sp.]|nr:tetratricopeptide repeat protein [Sulfurimicrobium sp.]